MSKVIDMKEKRMEKRVKTEKVLIITKAEYDALSMTIAALSSMHLKLIRLHEEETRLKKHHKAYLHIRDLADQACREHREKVSGILEMLVKHHYEEACRLAEEDAVFHPGGSYPGSLNEEDRDETPEEDGSSISYDFLPDGMVFVSIEDFELMEEDILVLTDIINTLAAGYYLVEEEKIFPKEHMVSLLDEAMDEAKEVFERWSDADMLELD